MKESVQSIERGIGLVQPILLLLFNGDWIGWTMTWKSHQLNDCLGFHIIAFELTTLFVWYQIAIMVFEETMTLLVTCSFLFFLFVFSLQWCNALRIWKNLLVQSVERGTTHFTDWFDSGCIVVWLNRVELEILFFYFFWSSDTTLTEPVEPWLENLTNSISVQIFKSLQWWHYFSYGYCYLWKL